MEKTENQQVNKTFKILNDINVSDKTKQKLGLTYL